MKRAYRAANVALARRTVDGFLNHSANNFKAPYEELLRVADVREQLIAKQVEVIEALIDGAEQDFPDVERAMRRARFYANDQAGVMHRDISVARARKTGAIGFEWTRTRSANPRPEHLNLIGKRFRWGEEPVMPGTLPNCKCGMKPLYPEDFTDG